jgi:LytS/YehU family sensor histidine kinase
LKFFLISIGFSLIVATGFMVWLPMAYPWGYHLLALVIASFASWLHQKQKERFQPPETESLFDQTFLLNTLHNITALIDIDKEAASRTVQHLADYIRAVMAQSQSESTLLAHEVRCVSIYLEIEKARLGERLEVNIDVPKECYEVCVPRFFLQPLVETAIRYGAENHDTKTKITLVADRNAKNVNVDLSDVSETFDNDPEKKLDKRKPVLAKVRNNLENFYQQKVPVELFSVIPSGCRTLIHLPTP